MGVASGIIIVVLILVAIFADQVAPYGVSEVAPQDRLTGPSAKYLLGSDQLGRDLFSRLIYGARLSLVVGLSATALNVAVAVLIGGSSGFLGGRFDLVVQRVVDAWMAFPGLLILLAVMSLTGPGVLQIIVVLGVTGGITGSRVVRAAVIGIKESDYFTAAQAVGTPTRLTLVRHLLPKIKAPIIIIFSINVGGVIIAEASLSFLGCGLPASVPSWGGMLSREGRSYMEIAPWLAIWPGVFLTITVYSLNMFGGALRDLLDPRLRGGTGRLGSGGANSAAAETLRRSPPVLPAHSAARFRRSAKAREGPLSYLSAACYRRSGEATIHADAGAVSRLHGRRHRPDRVRPWRSVLNDVATRSSKRSSLRSRLGPSLVTAKHGRSSPNLRR